MKTIQTTTIVLHKLAYGEKDLIVKLLTQEGEIVSAFAKSGQNSSRRFGPVLDAFNQVSIVATQRPHSSLLNLQGANLILPMDAVRLDLVKFAIATFFAEMTLTFVRECDRLPALYEDFLLLLETISHPGPVDEAHIPVLEYKWLQHLGFNPELVSCLACQCHVQPQQTYYFASKNGGIYCHDCQKQGTWSARGQALSYQSIQLLTKKILSEPLPVLQKDNLIDSSLVAEKSLQEKSSHEKTSHDSVRSIRLALENFIEYTAGKNLKSLQFLNQVLE